MLYDSSFSFVVFVYTGLDKVILTLKTLYFKKHVIVGTHCRSDDTEYVLFIVPPATRK